MFTSRCWLRCPGILLLFAFLFPAASLRAQAPDWPYTGAAFSVSPQEILSAASHIKAEQYAEATVLFERDSWELLADGRSNYRHVLVYRIETESALSGWGETSSRYDPWHQNPPTMRARVILPDGRVSQLDEKTITDGPASESEEQTYTDARIRKAPLPGLAVGAIVEKETVVEDTRPFFAGGGVYRDFFARGVPIIHYELTIDTPKDASFQYRPYLLPGLQMTDEEKDGVRHLRFTRLLQDAQYNSDIDLPTHNHLSPMVEFATGKSWASVAQSYRELSEPRMEPAQAKALLPARKKQTRMEYIAEIVARLHREVRYTGIEFGQAALQPATSSEVLKRHYGDCKDKAALLVTMLRAAEIPAYMALLDVGPGMDVTPDMPGMNQFDHAIVYVPAASPNESALWIDATAEYSQVGTLPTGDQGRLALVIAPDTKELTEIPIGKAEENSLLELRDVRMAANGWAHISETSLTHGDIDASYRNEFGEDDSREKRANLESYAKDHYLAKALVNVEHGDGKDLTKEFRLKLDMDEARRGTTEMDDAAVAIPYSALFNRLAAWFRRDPHQEGEKLTPQQEENRKRAVAARTSEYDVSPLQTEWRYTITTPEGFELRALPEGKTIAMGPAQFRQHYTVDKQGVITADLVFNTGKPRYTQEEALALRDAVQATYKQDMLMIFFDQVGSKRIAAGKFREGLAADYALIEKHPKDALHHAQMAYALLESGLGARARDEARKATELDPKSKVAFKALGWVCQFNAIGVRFAYGFDWDCAVKAIKRATELDPDDDNSTINYAILNEYDRDGERYAAKAPLDEAIRVYTELKKKDKQTGDQYEDNMLFDLLYSGKEKELLEELEKQPSSESRHGLAIAATVALAGDGKGVAAGIEKANHIDAGAQERASALSTAGSMLIHMRKYAEAAEILAAAVEGRDNASQVSQQINVFKKLTPWDGKMVEANDATGAVKRMTMDVLLDTWTEPAMRDLLAMPAYANEQDWKRNLHKLELSRGMLHQSGTNADLPAAVLLDVVLGHQKVSAQGTDETGYRVTTQQLGMQPSHYFVSKLDGRYRIVTDGKTWSETGNYVLYLLKEHRETEARSLLDWLRDQMHRGGGDDPLSGPLLPRFWTVGDKGDATAMRQAAASLLLANDGIRPLLPELRAAWEKATSEEQKLNLGLVLSNAYAYTQEGEALKTVSAPILEKYPDSYEALDDAAMAYVLLKDWTRMNAVIDKAIEKHPEDEALLRLRARYAEEAKNWNLSREATQKVIDLGKATAFDYNNLAWISLFDGKVDADALKAAQQSTMESKNSSFSELHTLACVYAVQGKLAEARDLLTKGMSLESETSPNSEVWYALASIYEQYGLRDAAVEAYKRVEKPEGYVHATSTWLLAQSRLQALGASL